VQNVIFSWNVFNALGQVFDWLWNYRWLLIARSIPVCGVGDEPFHYWEVLPLSQFLIRPHKTYDGRKTQESWPICIPNKVLRKWTLISPLLATSHTDERMSNAIRRITRWPIASQHMRTKVWSSNLDNTKSCYNDRVRKVSTRGETTMVTLPIQFGAPDHITFLARS